MMNTRRVSKDGSIRLCGRKYLSEDLLPFAGKIIKTWLDDSIANADAICFTLKGEFITNANNPELWAELMK